MKELWIEITSNASTSEKAKLLKLAKEHADTLLEGTQAQSKQDEDTIQVLDSFDANAIQKLKSEGKKAAVKITIKGKQEENIAAKAAEGLADYIIIKCADWRVIPLENLIARTHGKSKLIADVSNAEEAKLVLETLELGTDGVLLHVAYAEELMKAVAVIKKQISKIRIVPARITAVNQINTGARVCVDTCDLMEPGEGMLIGVQAAGFFLVEAEVHENPYVQSRPFRVNAGSLSMYILAPQQKTRYLSELKSGDEVLIVNREGKVRTGTVGRVKIELRPLILVEAEVDKKKIKTILQNAETIRLVTAKGSKSVTELNIGDEVLTYVAMSAGRHFGVAVPDETVIER